MARVNHRVVDAVNVAVVFAGAVWLLGVAGMVSFYRPPLADRTIYWSAAVISIGITAFSAWAAGIAP